MELSNKNVKREGNNSTVIIKELTLKIYNIQKCIWIPDHIRSL